MTLRPKFLNKLALIGSFRILQTRNTIIGKIADWFGFSSFSRTVILPTMEFKPSKFSCELTAGQLRQKKFCGFVPGGLEPKKFVPERAQLRPVAARRRHWVRRGASKRRRDQSSPNGRDVVVDVDGFARGGQRRPPKQFFESVKLEC